jgi:hypothetical protein
MSERARQPSRDITAPEPGLFRMTLCRGGPPVAAAIVSKLGTLTATINGCAADVEQVWTSGTFIDRVEFDQLDANRPADPTKPVDYRAMGHVSSPVTAGQSNRPVVDLAAALEPSALAAWLEHEFAEHEARGLELSAAFARFLTATADGIHDDAVTGRATDFAKVHKAELAAIDATRTRIKAPVLHAQRLIDGQGKALADPLKANVAEIEARIADYLTAKAEAARRAAEAEAAMRDISEPVETPPTLPDLTRTRSLTGALAGLKDNWVWTLEDITKVPTHLLQVNEAAVRLAIRQGAREVPGLRIWNDTKMFVR